MQKTIKKMKKTKNGAIFSNNPLIFLSELFFANFLREKILLS